MFKSSEDFNAQLVSLCKVIGPKNTFVLENVSIPSHVKLPTYVPKLITWPENVWTTPYQPVIVQDITIVLRVSEIGFDIKDGSYRIGDGTTAYSELAINRRPE
jgi:hypothetical protein